MTGRTKSLLNRACHDGCKVIGGEFTEQGLTTIIDKPRDSHVRNVQVLLRTGTVMKIRIRSNRNGLSRVGRRRTKFISERATFAVSCPHLTDEPMDETGD